MVLNYDIVVSIKRCGNLLEVTATEDLYKYIAPALTYNHRTFFQGAELYKRKALARKDPHKRINPEFEVVPKKLYQIHGNKLYCAAGLKAKIVTLLSNSNIKYTYEDLRKKKLPAANYDRLLEYPELDLRYKQADVLSIVDACDGGIFHAPTGYGKTFLMILLTVVYPTARILIVSPGIDLLKSTYERLLTYAPGNVGRVGNGKLELSERITLCSIDSLHKIDLGWYNLIVGDEVHSFATDVRAKNLCASYTDAKFIGFTASPNMRADGADAIIESIFGPVLLKIDYAEAVEAGSVAKINTVFVNVPKTDDSPNVSGEMWQRKKSAYWCNSQRNSLIASVCSRIPAYLQQDNPQMLIMVETVEHIYELRQYLPGWEVVYANMQDGELNSLRMRLISRGLLDENEPSMTLERRNWLLKEFEAGRLKRVIANKCWKQGIDPKHLQAFIRADGGTSGIDSVQLPGRLSRITESKYEGLLVDFDDSFDLWAKRRADKRKSSYRKNGFNLVENLYGL
jgi:superfamily II DNA or RNA helicase